MTLLLLLVVFRLTSSSRFATLKGLESNETVFYVPAVSAKCRYNSNAGEVLEQSDLNLQKDSPLKIPTVEVETPGGSKSSLKHSSIYIWLALQSLPEMIISPCFLDFLEQTLQAIPVGTSTDQPHVEDGVGAVESLDSTIESLPMDTLVFLSIQPSQVLFNCHPMSRVECLFQIPSLDATFSNIRHPKEPPSNVFFSDKGV